MDNQTVFHKIVSKEVPAFIVNEDAQHMAFLDIYPSAKGQVVVIPKSFTTSHFANADKELLTSTLRFAQQTAQILEKKLANKPRVLLVIEGLEIDYLHIKLVPTYDLHQGVMQAGEAADMQELAALHKHLTT